MSPFQTKALPDLPDVTAPDGSDVRLLVSSDRGSMAHFSLAPGAISAAVCHRTVEELWFITAGDGQMWRSADGVEEIVAPRPPISCPTLVLTADEDFGNGPEMSAAIAAEIKGARLIILQGLRHMALVENPDAVNRPVMEFLTEVLA